MLGNKQESQAETRLLCLRGSDVVLLVGYLACLHGIREVIRVHHIESCIEDVELVLHSGGYRTAAADTHSTYSGSLRRGDAGGELGGVPLVPVVELEEESAFQNIARGSHHADNDNRNVKN
jgi:hypothetical protein